MSAIEHDTSAAINVLGMHSIATKRRCTGNRCVS